MEASANSESVGKVIALSGKATAVSSKGERILEMGSPVYQDDVITTGDGSKLQVRFHDNTQVSQDENSSFRIDSYVYNADAQDNSDLLLNMMKGTFRTISGEIVKDSPTQFMLKTPQGTIGIRGTIVVSEVTNLYEKHGVEELTPGKILVITDNFGNIRIFKVPMKLVEFYQGKPVSEVRDLLLDELDEFQQRAPLDQHDGDGGDGDQPLGYTAPDGFVAGVDVQGTDMLPSDFGLMGSGIFGISGTDDFVGVFDTLADVPGYEEYIEDEQNNGNDDNNGNEDIIPEGEEGGDSDPSGEISIAAVEQSQSESDDESVTYTFTVTRTGDISSEASVQWTVNPDGANPANADDFGGEFPSGVVTFEAGQDTVDLMIEVTGDNDIEADESFSVVLSNPTGDMAIGTQSVSVLIENDDYSAFSFSIVEASNFEGSDTDIGRIPMIYEVTRTGDIDFDTQVAWSVTGSGTNPADADDFGGELPSGIIYFEAGQETARIYVEVSGDRVIESDETFTIALSNPEHNETLEVPQSEGTILNDDIYPHYAGSEGDDAIEGFGGSDDLWGSQDPNDVQGFSYFSVDGGEGTDTLLFNGVDIDFTAISNDRVDGIEAIDLLSGEGENNLTLSLEDVLDMSQTTDTLIIDGGSDDTVTVADGTWIMQGQTTGDNGELYHVFACDGATLQIDTDIQLSIDTPLVI